MWRKLTALLQVAIQEAQLPALDPTVLGQLSLFVDSLQTWNKALNLTGTIEVDDVIRQHVVDSLLVAPWVKGQCILDVGSGAGFPGLVLAIVQPDVQYVLLDSRIKRIHFLETVIHRLNLSHRVRAVCARVENWRTDFVFDTIISRAVCSLAEFWHWTKHLSQQNTQYWALKGTIQPQEWEELLVRTKIAHRLPAPAWLGVRHLVGWTGGT